MGKGVVQKGEICGKYFGKKLFFPRNQHSLETAKIRRDPKSKQTNWCEKRTSRFIEVLPQTPAVSDRFSHFIFCYANTIVNVFLCCIPSLFFLHIFSVMKFVLSIPSSIFQKNISWSVS